MKGVPLDDSLVFNQFIHVSFWNYAVPLALEWKFIRVLHVASEKHKVTV